MVLPDEKVPETVGLVRTAYTVWGVTNEVVELSQTSTQEKINILEKTLSVMGNEEPILAGRK